MIFGYFDYVIIGILILLNIIYWKKEINAKIGCIAGVILFGFLLPLISQIIEVKRVQWTIGIIDNFEVLYTYLKFPIYWIIGIAQGLIISIKWGYKK